MARRYSKRELERFLRKARRRARQSNIPPALELTPREREVEAAISKDPAARRALALLVKRLVKSGVPEWRRREAQDIEDEHRRRLLIYLVQEAWGPVVIAKREPRGLTSTEISKGAATLKSLANRLKNAALDFPQPEPDYNEIALRESRLGHPKRAREALGIALLSPYPVYVLRHCAFKLKAASDWLTSHAHVLRGSEDRKVRTEYTLGFLHWLNKTTSHYSCGSVAALMRVTHRMAGRGERVSADSLYRLIHRYRH